MLTLQGVQDVVIRIKHCV